MTINDFQSYLSVIITLIGFLYVFAKFKAEFDLHKRVLNEHEKVLRELLYRVERIDIRQQTMSEEFNLMKGFIFGSRREGV